MRIAFIGKGGNGKSTVAGTVARLLGRRGCNVLALDVDTMPGLSISLGFEGTPDSTIPDDLAVKGDGVGWAMKEPAPSAREMVDRYAQVAADNVRFLEVGKYPAPIPQARNTAFRYVVEKFDEPGWSVVVDLAAGVRQASYGWASFSTLLAIVMEPTQASAMTVRRLRRIAQDLPGLHVGLILNKQQGGSDSGPGAPEGIPIWARLPYSEDVVLAEKEGAALLDLAPESPLIGALDDMITNLLEQESVEKIA